MPQTVDQVRRQCLALGMDADEPLAALLIGLAEGQAETRRLVEEASRKIGSGANAISPDAEQALVKRVGQSIAQEAWRQVGSGVREVKRVAWLATAAVLAIVITGSVFGGYWWGHGTAKADIHQTETGLATAFANGPEAAKEWWSLMAWNDPRKALANCKVRVDGGRRACDLPMWIEGPQAPAGKGR